jgi:hypothetical protein
MRIVPRAVLAGAAVVAALALAAPAVAAPPNGHGILKSPNGSYRGHSPGYWIAQWWAGALSAPADETNPAIAGTCVLQGTVAIHYSGGDCTLPAGTAIFEMLFSTECSNREPDPFHAESAEEAEACGRANAGVATSLRLRVDDGPWLELLDDRYAAVLPWTTVPWPENNIFGLPGGGEISFGGYGLGALLRPLPPGVHTIDFVPEGEGAPPPWHATITIV